MRNPLCTAFALAAPILGFAQAPQALSLHDFTVRTLDGHLKALSDYKGKVVLVVNVASECGFTPQYEGLQRLYTEYRPKGLEVLGFPCNQFGGQEPGSAEQIQTFCSATYHVTFPLFEKLDVKGAQQAPVYAFLSAKHGLPTWNFFKYLVDKDGKVLTAFPSKVTPESAELRGAIDRALAQAASR